MRLRNFKIKFKGFSGLTLIELLVVISVLGVLAAILFAVLDPLQQKKKANDALGRNTAAEFLQAAFRYNTDSANGTYPWNENSSCAAITPPTGQTTFPCYVQDNSCNNSYDLTKCPVGCNCQAWNICSQYSIYTSSVCPGYPWVANGGDILGVTSCPNGVVPTPIGATPTPTPAGFANLLTPVPLSQLSGCINSIISQGDLKGTFTSLPVGTLQSVYLTQPNPILTPPDANSLVACYLPTSRAGQLDGQAKYTINGYIIPLSGGINPGGSGVIYGYTQAGVAVTTPAGTCISEGGQNYCYTCSY